MTDPYTTLRTRGLTTSRRHFSRHWCGKAPNYMAVTGLSAVSTNETDSGFLLAEGFGLIAVT